MRAILDLIESAITAEAPVYVHCWGGIGRTGTVVCCWLVERGLSGEQALVEIALLRDGIKKRQIRRRRCRAAGVREGWLRRRMTMRDGTMGDE